MKQKKMMKQKKPKPVELFRKAGLYLADTADKGRGVFCRTDIRRGELLEVTPALIMNEKANDRIDSTILADYAFSIDGLSKSAREEMSVKKAADASAVVMGLLSFCNHSDKPNAEPSWEEEEDGSVHFLLKATRAIPRGTEICTSYGRDWFKDRHQPKGK